MLGFRRPRKSSPDPHDLPTESSDASCLSAQQATPQSRRRTKHVSSAATSPPSVRKRAVSLPLYHAPGTSTCNNFLLGGHYYPGKDKKAIHLRQRTWWYRFFCSSSRRTILSMIIVSYILLWQVLVPTVHVVLDYGRLLAGERRASAGMRLLPINEQKGVMDNIIRIKDKLKDNSRFVTLEKIVPLFYHRNDEKQKISESEKMPTPDDVSTPNNALTTDLERHRDDPQKHRLSVEAEHKEIHYQDLQAVHRDGQETRGATERKGDAQGNDQNHGMIENTDGKTPGDTLEAKLGTNNEESTPQGRTLQNMETFLNESHCPDFVERISTTLVIQCSSDRLWMLEETCRRWRDPIVVVVYYSYGEASSEPMKTMCPHLTMVPIVSSKKEIEKWHYPVNHLRNLGLDVVQTSHVAVIDADFVPSQNLDQTIREVLEDRRRQRNMPESLLPDEYRDAVVIPAFERVEDCAKNDCPQFLKTNSSFLPRNIDELRDCMRSQSCIIFQSKNNWEGHYSTNSHTWLQGNFYDTNVTLADHSYSSVIRKIDCFDSLRYEPYVVIRWCPSAAEKMVVAPYYDERFYGYGKNKIQYVSHLRFLGYQFSVLPKGFIVHNPHAESEAKHVWNDVHEHSLHKTMDSLYPQFLQELYTKYYNLTNPRDIVQTCVEKAKH